MNSDYLTGYPKTITEAPSRLGESNNFQGFISYGKSIKLCKSTYQFSQLTVPDTTKGVSGTNYYCFSLAQIMLKTIRTMKFFAPMFSSTLLKEQGGFMKMSSIVFFFFLFCLPLNLSFAEDTKVFQFSKTYQTETGPVIFTHERHADTYAKDCAFCHIALNIFGGEMNKMFAHNFCNDCHVQRSVSVAGNCQYCHSEPVKLSMK